MKILKTLKISYSVRSVPVSYSSIKDKFIVLMSNGMKNKEIAEGICLAWGIALNNEGLKGLNGRTVEFEGQEHTYVSLLDVLKSQEEYDELDYSQRKQHSKTSVTIARIARAYAPENREVIMIEPECCTIPESVRGRLPKELAFPNGMYACTVDELKKYKDEFTVFYQNWQLLIQNAVGKNWIKKNGNEIRDWVSAFETYYDFVSSKSVTTSSKGIGIIVKK
jgi:hypothetical protein